MGFREIIESVNGSRSTLTLLNVDAPPEVVETIADFLEPQQVRLVRDETDRDRPTNVALLHHDGALIAASDLLEVYRRVDVETGLHTATDLDAVEYPDVLSGIDDTTFSELGKRRMIVASREIEKRAWEVDAGELHVGFQRLSLLSGQQRIYRKLGESDVETHVYGRPDVAVPDDVAVAAHPSRAEEVTDFWFVLFDGAGRDGEKCGLLAEEVAPDRYSGFWTYRAELVDGIFDRLTDLRDRL